MKKTKQSFSEASAQRVESIIEEMPMSRLRAIQIAMEVGFAAGVKNGKATSGNYAGYWCEDQRNPGTPALYAVTYANESLDDYLMDSEDDENEA